MKNFVQRHPVLAYFVLVYVLTWGGILLIVQALASAAGMDPAARVGIVALPMLFAPAIAGISITALAEGKAGLRAMWSRMTHWRVEIRWYALALAVMPLLVLAILYAFALLISPAYAPILSLLGLAGIVAGYLEEIGWTGFAVPRLLNRWSPLVVGLVVGLLWGVWHGLADYVIRAGTLGEFWPIAFGLFVVPLTAWRILMVWVYDHTRSGFVSQLMHFSYTGSLAFFIPLGAISHTDDALIYLALAGALWIGVVMVAIGQRRAQQLLQPQAGRTS